MGSMLVDYHQQFLKGNQNKLVLDLAQNLEGRFYVLLFKFGRVNLCKGSSFDNVFYVQHLLYITTLYETPERYSLLEFI